MKSRRSFLAQASLAAAAVSAGSLGMPRFSIAQNAEDADDGKVFIKVFMRGGADGMHLFPPYTDPNYYALRPNLAIEAPLDSDSQTALSMGNGSYRGMNPNMLPLMDLWDDGKLLVSPCTSFVANNRSHFDCQRWIGTGQRNNLIDGYLNRLAGIIDNQSHPIKAATLGKSSQSREMVGEFPSPVIQRQRDFNVQNNDFCQGSGCAENQLLETMMELAQHPTDLSEVEGQVRDNQLLMIESIEEIQGLGDYAPASNIPPIAGPGYTNTSLGRGLQLCAQLIKGGVPLQIAAVDWDGSWDSHDSQIIDGVSDPFTNSNLFFNSRIASGSQDLRFFYEDMGDLMDNIVVLICTEFGRTSQENGSIGTDHGVGAAWMAFGGPTQGGWAEDITSLPSVPSDGRLPRDDRWLPNLVSYRDLAGEIIVRHFGLDPNIVSQVFPGHSFTDLGHFNATV